MQTKPAEPRSRQLQAEAGTRPDWDLTPYFPELGGEAYVAFRDLLAADLGTLRERAESLPALDANSLKSWADLLLQVEQAGMRAGHLGSYLSCLTAADSSDEHAARERAGMARISAAQEKLSVAVRAALGRASAADFETLVGDPRLTPVRHYLTRQRELASRSMSPELEGLSSDLSVDGFHGWGRLYTRVAASLRFTLEVAGAPARELPVSMTRTLLEDADPAVRTAALRGSAAAWERVSDSMAACLNAISGTRLALYPRRGIQHFLEPALFGSSIERTTLDAMWGAVRARQEVPRAYLRRKAQWLGVKQLGFQDLMAPLPAGADEAFTSWEQARERVCTAFGAVYPALREFAEHAFARRWIDYRPRPNKSPGGFCTSSSLIRESRVFVTYGGSMGDVQTLAHELGHAFHNWVMRDMRSWARSSPMTLAETASTFAEQVVIDAALENPRTSPALRAAILDHRLQDGSTFLLNIPMRFDFEYELYTRRAAGELSVRELKELMLDAQRCNYGDALADDQLDPWFWASKLHFYQTHVAFYNFPYTFGYLFSRGLSAHARREGPAFLPRYEALLRSTGSAPAERVVRDALGVDLQTPTFWNSAIDLIEADLREFQKLTPG